VPRDVLEGRLILGGALGGLAEQQFAGRHRFRQVAALLVGLGPLAHLNRERRGRAGEPGEQLEVERRAEVVRV